MNFFQWTGQHETAQGNTMFRTIATRAYEVFKVVKVWHRGHEWDVPTTGNQPWLKDQNPPSPTIVILEDSHDTLPAVKASKAPKAPRWEARSITMLVSTSTTTIIHHPSSIIHYHRHGRQHHHHHNHHYHHYHHTHHHNFGFCVVTWLLGFLFWGRHPPRPVSTASPSLPLPRPPPPPRHHKQTHINPGTYHLHTIYRQKSLTYKSFTNHIYTQSLT